MLVVERADGTDWSFFLSPLPLLLTGTVLAVTFAWRWVGIRVGAPELRALAPLRRLTPWVPRLLAIHLGVALLAPAATGAFVTPGVDHLDAAAGTLLLLGEAALGAWLVSGVAALVAMVPFNATLALFGQTELVGHLPVYGVFLALLVYGSDPETAPLVRWLPRRRAAGRTNPVAA